MSALIDLASTWVSKKAAAYLAKENVIVYYASHTGRKSDYKWHKLSLSEVARIINTFHLTASAAIKVSKDDILVACQELDRVYEYGTQSSWTVAPEVFNYFAEADTTLGEQIMELIVEELKGASYYALLLSDVARLFDLLNVRLEAGVNAKTARDLLLKHFHNNGYVVRTGAQRVLISAKKVSVIIMAGAKPRDVVHLSDAYAQNLMLKVAGALK